MGAVEHLKTLCCLGLKPESAMIAVTPLLHEIIPHGWFRACLFEPDATFARVFAENHLAVSHQLEGFEKFANDSSSIASVVLPSYHAGGIGWTLHLQGRDWLESTWYREVEAPFDSCWILDAMLRDGGRTIAGINLTRPRSARAFTVDDVRCLDRLRPGLAHALRPSPPVDACPEDQAPIGTAGKPVASGQIILTPDANHIHQTPGIESLLRILAGEPGNYPRYALARDRLPAPVLKLLRQVTGAANVPPRMQVSTAYGVLTLDAKWLVPAGTLPADAARDPKSCLISVTIDLHEHAIAFAARVLRESGATPAQTKVGIHLALGKPKSVIAHELGIQLSSVMATTKKLYQNLDVHNSAELATKIWLDRRQSEARQSLRHAG